MSPFLGSVEISWGLSANRVSIPPSLIQNRTDISVPVQPNSHAKLCNRLRKALHPSTQSIASAHAKLCIPSTQSIARNSFIIQIVPYATVSCQSIKAKVKDYYVCPDPTSFKITTRTTKIGNTYTTTSSINRDILGWYNFYSIYPISKELYNLIKDNGIEEVAVEGVAPIIIK